MISSPANTMQGLLASESGYFKRQTRGCQVGQPVCEWFGQVGNFRVEPPGLFRGRGEHPKMGRIKRRIYPKDIVINIGKGVPVPEHPFPDQHWKMVRHLTQS